MSPEQQIAYDEHRKKLTEAIGECVLSWAKVEFQLSLIFGGCIGGNAQIPHAVLSTVQSFGPRLSMIDKALRIALDGTPVLNHWVLLLNYTLRLSKRRNEIVHASESIGDKWLPVLVPFFMFTERKPLIELDQVKELTKDINELALCLSWFADYFSPPPGLPLASPRPLPDLLLRLQTQDARIREEQRAQQRPSPRR